MSFIVIEGLDGSGKSTQVNKLCNLLTEKKIKFEYLHFPQINEHYFGALIGRFLRGELGDLNSVDPWVVAMLFAGNRWAAMPKINAWLEEGTLVLIDRYVFSNIAYQVAKVNDNAGKEKLRNWIYQLEYNEFKIPKPDINIWLDAPLSFVEQQLFSKRQGDDRSYLQGAEDIHETSIDFQQNVYQEYITCCNQFSDLQRIPCYNSDNKMLAENEIFTKLIENLKDYLPNKIDQ